MKLCIKNIAFFTTLTIDNNTYTYDHQICVCINTGYTNNRLNNFFLNLRIINVIK